MEGGRREWHKCCLLGVEEVEEGQESLMPKKRRRGTQSGRKPRPKRSSSATSERGEIKVRKKIKWGKWREFNNNKREKRMGISKRWFVCGLGGVNEGGAQNRGSLPDTDGTEKETMRWDAQFSETNQRANKSRRGVGILDGRIGAGCGGQK